VKGEKSMSLNSRPLLELERAVMLKVVIPWQGGEEEKGKR